MPTFRICYRKDTAENWEKNNPILLEGEVGYEVDDKGTIKSKMGDGYLASDGKIHGTPWNDLPYVSGPPGPPPEHKWEGGMLLFQNPDGTWDEGHSLTGPMPAHRWLGTALQWETPSGAWGDAVDLQGAPGNASLLPATTTRLGGIIVGDGLTINENGCLNTQINAGNLFDFGGQLLVNEEVWITESGEWEVPFTGWYNILLISGGEGGLLSQGSVVLTGGGYSGSYRSALSAFKAGEKIQITIGTGGIGIVGPDNIAQRGGSVTYFGTLRTPTDDKSMTTRFSCFPERTNNLSAVGQIESAGSGFGGGGTDLSHKDEVNGWFWGAGGGAVCSTSDRKVGNGKQGAIRLRFYNPNKAAGASTLSVARMALEAQPATVNLYDPKTGQGSVWNEADAQSMLDKGFIAEDVWLEQQAKKAAEEYKKWVENPDTVQERFRLLRQARDAKLSATDYLVTPDYPLTEEQHTEVTTYRQALRDLPQQTGAPWDGGGEATPWPNAPSVIS